MQPFWPLNLWGWSFSPTAQETRGVTPQHPSPSKHGKVAYPKCKESARESAPVLATVPKLHFEFDCGSLRPKKRTLFFFLGGGFRQAQTRRSALLFFSFLPKTVPKKATHVKNPPFLRGEMNVWVP